MANKAQTIEKELRAAVDAARDVGMTESLVRKIVEQTLNSKRG
jgi:hypothetical protein